MRQAAAIGMFDGVHLGHQALMRELRAHARLRGLRAVAYTFDRHPLEVVAPAQAPLLLTAPGVRAELLVAAGADECVIMTFDQELRMLTAEQFLRLMHDDYGVDMLLVGFDHRFGRDRRGDFDAYRAIGASIGMEVVRSVERVTVEACGTADTVSSSAVRDALLTHRVDLGAAMLGRYYGFSGTVAHGRSIGHTIGFPTANIVPGYCRQLVPARGVYAAVARYDVDGRAVAVPAMVNIGSRPTIEGRDDAPVSIEAHLIGQTGDFYGRCIGLDFVSYVRAERRFETLAALSAQLRADRDVVKSIIDKIDSVDNIDNNETIETIDNIDTID